MFHQHVVVGLHQLEHGADAAIAVEHEGGAAICRHRRDEAGHDCGDCGGIGFGGAAGVGCCHGRTAAMLRHFPRSVHMSPDDHAYAPDARAKNKESRIEIMPSVCPHDCTSTCALEVE